MDSKYTISMTMDSMDVNCNKSHTVVAQRVVQTQETTHMPSRAPVNLRPILPSPIVSQSEANNAMGLSHLKSKRSPGPAKARHRGEVQRIMRESRTLRPLLAARVEKEDDSVSRVEAQEKLRERIKSTMRESRVPRPLLPMPTATMSDEMPDSESQAAPGGGSGEGPGDRYVSSRMQVQRVMRESRVPRPLLPTSGQVQFPDVRKSDLAQGLEKESGRSRGSDETGTLNVSRQSSRRQSQTKADVNARRSLPTLPVTVRDQGKGSKEFEFVLWEGHEEKQIGLFNCEGEGSNLRMKINQRKESNQSRASHFAGSSLVPETFTRHGISPAVSYEREPVWSTSPEGGASRANRRAIERNPFLSAQTGSAQTDSEQPRIKGKRKRRSDLSDGIGIGRQGGIAPVPIVAELGEAASLGRSLAPRRRDGVQDVQTNPSQESAAVTGSQDWRAESHSRKRKSRSQQSIRPPKQSRVEDRRHRCEDNQKKDLKVVLQWLENEYETKSQLSSTRCWCMPIPLERKVQTVQKFYSTMHDTKTLPIQTCLLCYRKFSQNDLEKASYADWQSLVVEGGQWPMPLCVICYPSNASLSLCKGCARLLEQGFVSPAAQIHTRLGCEHTYPDALKGLTPVEEKLISVNSCYGFITKHSVESGHRQDMRYPRHVKGHILVFPNNVEDLATKVLPHPLIQVMEDIHVSWHGRERPEPKDLSELLSVRREKVEAALRWLKKHNRHYRDITIDVDEMNSWTQSPDGVPHMIYERMERNEPSAQEKMQTAQVVPPTERGADVEEHEGNIQKILSQLRSPEEPLEFSDPVQCINGQQQAGSHEQMEGGESNTFLEMNVAGMFSLDGAPDIPEAEKFRYFCSTVQKGTPNATDSQSARNDRASGSANVKCAKAQKQEPYIHISRGDDFADGLDTWFFAKAFPTLFPYGFGGPRLAEEAMVGLMESTNLKEGVGRTETAATSSGLIGSRNMSLRAWAEIVLRRHGGRFAKHHVFSFLVFNLGVRSRNRRISMLSMNRKNFSQLECLVHNLSATRLEAAQTDLQQSNTTSDEAVRELLRSISLYGHRQPMSREQQLSLRRKIKSLIIRYGMPAIWFTLNPNDITNPIKLRLAAYRTRDPKDAEEFLRSLDVAYKRARLAVSDPMSSAVFFHREMSLFFEHYVKVGEESVFGRISQYFGAVETNERGALHVHGLLWLEGNLHLGSLLHNLGDNKQEGYGDGIARFAESIFSEELDQEAFSAVQSQRRVTTDVSDLVNDTSKLTADFEEEANFCAGATQIHTHSPTCVKYSFSRRDGKRNLCRFRAPWKLIERTAFTDDGVLQIRRTHPLVNRWNKAMAVGLRHNHDISFIATQCKTKALVFYVTNYATKVEDPVWKRVAAALEFLPVLGEKGAEADGAARENSTSRDASRNKTRQFLMRVANRVFTDRALSQVEVVSHLLGYPREFMHNTTCSFLNVSLLYWHVFRRWQHLRSISNEEGVVEESVDETILVEERGKRISYIEAYAHRGEVLKDICLYDYVSVVSIRRKNKEMVIWGEIPFLEDCPTLTDYTQVLRRPGKHATVCLDGYLSVDFNDMEDSKCFKRCAESLFACEVVRLQNRTDETRNRAAVQHLALFVPWEKFLSERTGGIDDIWKSNQATLEPRLSFLVDNIQLLRHSAEDAKRDAKQWAVSSGDGDSDDEGAWAELNGIGGVSNTPFRGDNVGNAMRLIDVIRAASGASQITSGSAEFAELMWHLCRFQEAALSSPDELNGCRLSDAETMIPSGMAGSQKSSTELPRQSQVRAIRSQQASAFKEIERMIQGIQDCYAGSAQVEEGQADPGNADAPTPSANADSLVPVIVPSARVCLGSSTSCMHTGVELATDFTLNKKQRVAFLLICRQLDRIWSGESGARKDQHCQFIGGEGGTGKSRVIQALVALFKEKGISNKIIVTATSGTAAAQIDGITIHSACNVSINSKSRTGMARDVNGEQMVNKNERFVSGPARMNWQEKLLLIVDEISMLGARTLFAVNEQLCRLRGSTLDFGGLPIVLFCGDFHQFRPVQERSILLSSEKITWDCDPSFGVEQRHQHDMAHGLWRKFSAVIMLDEQVRAAGDPEFQALLSRIRKGIQDQSDLELINRRCYREAARIPWETGITVVTPLNRNRWNLNMEGGISFRKQQNAQIKIFISEHKWRGVPTEEEAMLMLNQGDDSAVPVPAVFMFVPGMPIVVNQNTHQGLKVVNGAAYKAVDVVLNKLYPGHRISADIILHFGPPAAIVLTSESTKDFHFVGMPPGTILLTPVSVKIECQKKRPWQQTICLRRGLPCTAAFACTDYKVQSRTLEKVALELRGTRTMLVNGQKVPAGCDPYSLYVQLSRCPSLDGVVLLSKVRERDFIGNKVPRIMAAAIEKLIELGQKTMEEFEAWIQTDWGR